MLVYSTLTIWELFKRGLFGGFCAFLKDDNGENLHICERILLLPPPTLHKLLALAYPSGTNEEQEVKWDWAFILGEVCPASSCFHSTSLPSQCSQVAACRTALPWTQGASQKQFANTLRAFPRPGQAADGWVLLLTLGHKVQVLEASVMTSLSHTVEILFLVAFMRKAVKCSIHRHEESVQRLENGHKVRWNDACSGVDFMNKTGMLLWPVSCRNVSDVYFCAFPL